MSTNPLNGAQPVDDSSEVISFARNFFRMNGISVNGSDASNMEAVANVILKQPDSVVRQFMGQFVDVPDTHVGSTSSVSQNFWFSVTSALDIAGRGSIVDTIHKDALTYTNPHVPSGFRKTLQNLVPQQR